MKSVYTGGEKVAEFESYDELRVGDGKPAFIYEGNELVYPNPVKDGLVLWYDFSGRTNADGQRGIAEDLSGNGNNGILQNFNFTPESGYDKNKLLFDGVDDYLLIGAPSDRRFSLPQMTIEWNGLIREEQPLSGINQIFHGGYTNGWSLGYHGGVDRLMFTSRDSSDPRGYFIDYMNRPPKSELFSFVMTFKEGEKRGHLNGELINEFNREGVVEYPNVTSEIRIDRSVYQNTKSCKIYNRTLTPEEIAHNYRIEKERFGIE